MIFRQVNERVSFDNNLKHYFLFWRGDEILLSATTDEAAIKEAEDLVIELEQEV